jgi:hypothetical protein
MKEEGQGLGEAEKSVYNKAASAIEKVVCNAM